MAHFLKSYTNSFVVQLSHFWDLSENSFDFRHLGTFLRSIVRQENLTFILFNSSATKICQILWQLCPNLAWSRCHKQISTKA